MTKTNMRSTKLTTDQIQSKANQKKLSVGGLNLDKISDTNLLDSVSSVSPNNKQIKSGKTAKE